MTQEDFVTYEQAVKLKELGFDWECNHYYNSYQQLLCAKECALSPEAINNRYLDEIADRMASAPTLSQAAKWLREKGLFINVWRSKLGYSWDIDYIYIIDYVIVERDSTKGFDTYEDALSNAIDKALEILKTK